MCISTSASLRKSYEVLSKLCLTMIYNSQAPQHNLFLFLFMFFGRNITQRQRELLEEFSKAEQGEYEQRTATGSSQ